MTAQETSFSGSLFMVLGPYPSWPAVQEEKLCKKDMDNGILEVYATPNSTIRFALQSKNGDSIELETCQIVSGPQISRFILAASWEDSKVNLHINGHHVASTDQAVVTENSIEWFATATETREPREFIFIDVSNSNEECKLKRQSEVSSLTTRAGRIPASSDQSYVDLSNALKQLTDQMVAIRRGESYQDTALATRLRALICRPPSKSHRPLLQRCAGQLDLPLILYCIPPLLPQYWNPYLAEELPISLAISINFSPAKIIETQVPMDIDVWLEQQAARGQARHYTNDEVIRAFADTEGAHYDIGIEPLVYMLKRISAGTDELTLLHDYFLAVGECVAALGSYVLKSIP
jgi:hypothetical protein